MEQEVLELKEQMARLYAELKLINAKQPVKPSQPASPWLSLKEAACLLRFESARALKQRIQNGKIPPDCCQKIPSPSGKRHLYLVNVQRYLKLLK